MLVGWSGPRGRRTRSSTGRCSAQRLGTPYINVSDHWFSLKWYDGPNLKSHVYRLREGLSLHGDKSNEKIMHGTWDESLAVAQRRFGLDPADWRPVVGETGYWFPGAAADAAAPLKLS